MEELALTQEEISKLAIQFYEFAIRFGGKIVAGIFILIIGLWLIRKFTNMMGRFLRKRNVEETLIPFLKNSISVVLKVLLFITVVGVLGVETTSFIAVLGSAGLAVGLALQGSLANFAGGVIILILKPFQKGEFIEGAGQAGTVVTINIFNTELKTPNGQRILVPNGQLAGSTITNYATHPERRIVLTFGISYGDDIRTAKAILEKEIAATPEILQEPAPVIGVSGLGDSSVNLEIKVWVKREVYFDIVYKLLENVKYAFDENGISIPFPQQDVHLFQKNKS